eukprot:CAMPEP_0179210920 /NCGR_PEP_ID=MMETSP0797-20121207/61_1 /TAXON_ID=47934 /ORGANISM="Dinophysis acuminata, Strain DAEP01" /LENGTH=51 /DNA_ID=CAMNT_0020915961 /DNA_START=36 /DNA_END=188 /DNA_ORIENTATION=+
MPASCGPSKNLTTPAELPGTVHQLHRELMPSLKTNKRHFEMGLDQEKSHDQ